MRLFISHASEDKKDFVEPLAEALRQVYDVWYDKYVLRLGDSLLRKINEGLASCDFGVVVLSPHFFAKKWPQSELDGLFALETPSRKVILPIWKDVDEAEVKKSSPTLAGRYAARASDGVDVVVKQIRLAVDTSQRQREVTILETVVERFKGLAETLEEKTESEKLLQQKEGAVLVSEAIKTICDLVESLLFPISERSPVLKFEFKRSATGGLAVDCNSRVCLHFTPRNLAADFAGSSSLDVIVAKQKGYFLEEKWDVVFNQFFRPSFRRGRKVVWKHESVDRTLSNEELANLGLEAFHVEVERVTQERK